MTAERLWKRTGDYVFALAEMQIESAGRNVARGAAVTALDSIEAGRWSRRYLVDGYGSRASLPDLADAKTLMPPTNNLVYAVVPIPPRPIYVLHRGDVEQKRDLGDAGRVVLRQGIVSGLYRSQTERRRRPSRRLGRMDRGRAQSADMAFHRQSRLALPFRPRHRGHAERFRPQRFACRRIPNCSIGWRPSSATAAVPSRSCIASSSSAPPTAKSSADNAEAAKIDADARYLWRMTRQRLDAEEVRDATLAVSGKLDLKMGGPGFELFRFKDDHSPVYDHTAVDKINDPANWRRTIYRFTVRSVPNPFLDCLDCADPNVNTPVRNTTLTALQALALLNDPFMLKQADCFAERLRKISGDPAKQAEAAYRLAFGRPPTAEEREALMNTRRNMGWRRRAGCCSMPMSLCLWIKRGGEYGPSGFSDAT